MELRTVAGFAVLVLVTTAFAEPPAGDLVQKLADAVRKHCPQAIVKTTKEGFVARHGTMVYTVHGASMTGERDKETYQEEGPNYKGFMLRVSLHDGRYEGQADVPQTLHGPYFPTFIDAVPTQDGTKHYLIRFSYGGRLDPGLKDAIFAALPRPCDHNDSPPKTQVADTGEAKPLALKTGMVPIGSLGYPLGTYLTLEGKRAEGLKTGVRTLLIDKINGIALDTPRAIWVDNLDLPEGKRCVLKGYENARMIGSPDAYVEAMKELGKDAPMPQAGWQIHCFFVTLRVLVPEDLQIDK